MAEVAAAQPPVSPQVVGNAFVQQYYHILHNSPGLVFRFYQDTSKLGRPANDGSMTITTTMQAINDKILSLNYEDFTAEIKHVDSQESFNGGVHVLVTGYLTGKDNMVRNFSQTFFLAPQDRGYFVLNDMFRYVESVSEHDTIQVPETELASVASEQNPLPTQENHISEHRTPSADEASGEEVTNPPETDVPIEEEVPVAEVIDEVQVETQTVAESNIIIDEVPKKSYASIVMHLKESAATFSPPPAPAPRKTMPKSVELVSQPAAVAEDNPVLSSDSVGCVNNQEEEGADGYSIYLRGLPMNSTVALLEDEFKKFGPIKNGGIQVRFNRQQGFCFGFVEFEVATAVEKAIEAAPISIGGCRVVVEEKKSNSRGYTRGSRYPPGGGSGFRNGVRGHGNYGGDDGARGRGNYGADDGVRGRGNYGGDDGVRGRNYGGGRGYNRGDSNGRSEFNSRGGNRGGSSNRGGNGYQRTDMGGYSGRMNRGGGMHDGTARNVIPRVSATA